MSTLRIGTLFFARASVGVSSLILPSHVAPLFGVYANPEASIITRLFGIRDLVMAAYLWRANTAYKRCKDDEGADRIVEVVGKLGQQRNDGNISQKQHLKTALKTAMWLGLICDSVDVISSAVCILEGNLTDLAKVLVMGGAALFSMLAIGELMALETEQS